MAKSPRLSRLLLYSVLFAVSTHCRCRYEVVLFRGDAGEDLDTGVEAGTSTAFLLTTAGPRMLHGDDSAGTQFTEHCPEGQALIGYTGSHQEDGFMLCTGLIAQCGRLVLAADGTTITTEPTGTLTFRGQTSNVPADWTCPPNQVIVGVHGNAGTSQDGMGFYCAPLTLSAGVVTLGARTTLPVRGGNMGTPYDAPCPAGAIARGHYGSAFVYLHGFALECATPTPAP